MHDELHIPLTLVIDTFRSNGVLPPNREVTSEEIMLANALMVIYNLGHHADELCQVLESVRDSKPVSADDIDEVLNRWTKASSAQPSLRDETWYTWLGRMLHRLDGWGTRRG